MNLNTSRQKDMTPILIFAFLSEKKDHDLSPINSSRKMAACFYSLSDREGFDCLKKIVVAKCTLSKARVVL